jgi:hypothetical protein
MDCWLDPKGKEAESSQLPKGKKLPIATGIVSREDETKKEAASNFGMDCWLDPNGKEAEGWLSPVMTEHLFNRDPPQLPNWPIFKKARGAYFHFEPSQGFSDNVFFLGEEAKILGFSSLRLSASAVSCSNFKI